MKCSKCGSESYRIKNYDPYTNKFIYECNHCGSVIDCFNNETIYTNKSININKKSIEINKPYDTCSVNNTLQSCPNCGSSMILQTNGDFICSKCGLIIYTDTYFPHIIPLDSNSSIKDNLPPNEVKIIANKITITEKSTDIQLDISKNVLDNINSIVINGVRFSKECKDEEM